MYLTITLNPALDKIVLTHSFTLGGVNPIEPKETLAAGKGVDVAKVLRDLGHPVTACGFLGGSFVTMFERLFVSRGINDSFTRIKGQTRCNIHLIDESGVETELMEPAPVISDGEWKLFLERLEENLEGCELVAVCGSVPDNITPMMFSSMLDMISHYDLPILIDTQGKMLDVACTKHPQLIKFNREKIQHQLCKKQVSLQEMVIYGQNLLKMGVENVLISLDQDGALLICKEGIFSANAPKIETVSTIGCGDSMVASIAESMSMRRAPDEMLRHAVAIAAANAKNLETAKIDLAEYRALLEEVVVGVLR